MRGTKLRAGETLIGIGALLSSCAHGAASNSADTGDPADLSAEDSLAGSLEIMGFGKGDEIATVRYDRAEAALDDVEFSLVEGGTRYPAVLDLLRERGCPGAHLRQSRSNRNVRLARRNH